MSPDQPLTSSEGPQQSRKALNASGQSHASPNIVKPIKFVRQECADDGFTLAPEPKIWEVSGDVRRRTDQVPRAEPPPTNRATSSASSQQTSSSRRPQRNGSNHPGNGDSSGSESDDFDRNRKPAHAKAAVKKPTRRPVLAETPASFSADRSALEDEEMQRMSTFRTMRHLEETWPAVKHQRQLNRTMGLKRKRVLAQAKTKRELESSIRPNGEEWAMDLQQYVIRLDRQRRDYLDEALFNRFYATLDDGTLDSPEPALCHKRMVMERVKTEVLHQHQGFHVLTSEPYSTRQAHLDLVSVIRNITVRPRSSRPIVGTLVSQALVDSYVANIVQFSEDLILMGPSSLEDRLEMLCNLILDSPSHSGERLDEYIDWIYSGVDRAEFERCCLRAKEFDNFRVKTLPSLNDNSEQVLFSHLDAMYLVSFKEGFATSIKRLPKGDLRFLGWFPSCSRLGWSLPTDYLRLEYDPGWDSVFVVDANEQILGIYMFPGWVMAWDKDMENLVGIASSGSL
ncbi:hypothetical protein QBC37DRAFT_416845 [Rhypophila decipiens]|uniref:Uncharacterized protein n=1 Tax=Rhypophila decipiens TaxID=261697 RepID=A0AAN6YD98_9PEZI|nr:hypothetical protein QBC37DRAFT_416845 [Rhypophila decipiens]